MARNRALGSPYQVEVVTADFTTTHGVDAYMVDAAPLAITLDPYAANNDQVLIQDVTDTAGSHPIVISVSPGQTILNGYGDSISIDTNGGGVQLTMTANGWVPQLVSSAASSGGSSGLVATYSAQNADDLTVLSNDPSSPTTICQITGITLTALQKVIVHASVGFANVSESNTSVTMEILTSTGGPVDTVDGIGDVVPAAGTRAVTRVLEYTPGAGTYTFTLAASIGTQHLTVYGPENGPGEGDLAQGQLVVEVVSV